MAKVVGEHTFEVEDAVEPQKELKFARRVAAERTIRVETPELELGADQLRRVEIWEPIGNEWQAAEIERHSLDGRVYVRYDYDPTRVEWVDLSAKRYRWAIGQAEAVEQPPTPIAAVVAPGEPPVEGAAALAEDDPLDGVV